MFCFSEEKRTYVRMFVRLYVRNRHYPVLVNSEDLVVGNAMQAAINRAQLNLQEAVEFQQETFFDVVMKAADGKVFFVL